MSDQKYPVLVPAASGGLKVFIDDYNQPALDMWRSSSVSFASTRLLAGPLQMGTHRLKIEFHHYQTATLPKRARFYVGVLLLPNDNRWVGLKYNSAQGRADIYLNPVVVMPAAGEPLAMDWGKSTLPFTMHFIRRVTFPEAGRYLFSINTRELTDRLTLYYPATVAGSDEVIRWWSTVAGARELAIGNIPQGTYPLEALYSNAAGGVLAAVSLRWREASLPVLSTIGVSEITNTSAVISWNTNEPTTGEVAYGQTISYGATTRLDSNLQQAHRISISGLQTNVLYHYKISSRDAAGNLASSADLTFRTALPPCGNSQLDAGEECDLGALNGNINDGRCSGQCRWNTPQQDKHIECFWFDGLSVADSRYANDPLPTSGGRRALYDLTGFGSGKAFGYQLTPPSGLSHIGVRCEAVFNVTQERQYFSSGTLSSGSGGLKVWVDSFDGRPWFDRNGAGYGYQLKGAPLSAGPHRLRFEYQYYNDGRASIPAWFHVGWLPVSQDAWTGVFWYTDQPTSYQEPAIWGPVSGAPLHVSWGNGRPYAGKLMGSFQFPSSGQYRFAIDVDYRLLMEYVERYLINNQWEWGGMLGFRSSLGRTALEYPVPVFGGDGDELTNGRMTFLVHHGKDGGSPGHLDLSWEAVAPSCGNGRVDPGELCDHGGHPNASCGIDCRPPCGDGRVEAELGEQCEPPHSGTCDASCHQIGSGPRCNNNHQCESGETVTNCPGDCGDTSESRRFNRRFTDLSQDQGRLNGHTYMAWGKDPGCRNCLMITEEDSTEDGRVARGDTPVFVDDPSHVNPISEPDYARGEAYVVDVAPGVHQVSVDAPSGVTVYYSVSIGGRHHDTDNWYAGKDTGQFAIPHGSYASIYWFYLEPNKQVQTVYEVGTFQSGGGGGAAAVASDAMEGAITTVLRNKVASARGIALPVSRAVSFDESGGGAASDGGGGETYGRPVSGRVRVSSGLLNQEYTQKRLQRNLGFEMFQGGGQVSFSETFSCHGPTVPAYDRWYRPIDYFLSQNPHSYNGYRPLEDMWCYSLAQFPEGRGTLRDLFENGRRELGLPSVGEMEDPVHVVPGNSIAVGRIFMDQGGTSVSVDPPDNLRLGDQLSEAFVVRHTAVYPSDKSSPPWEEDEYLRDQRLREIALSKETSLVLAPALVDNLYTFHDTFHDTDDAPQRILQAQRDLICGDGECLMYPIAQALLSAGQRHTRITGDAKGLAFDALMKSVFNINLPNITLGRNRLGAGVWVTTDLTGKASEQLICEAVEQIRNARRPGFCR